MSGVQWTEESCLCDCVLKLSLEREREREDTRGWERAGSGAGVYLA